MKPRQALCVYTALLGGYESLNEQPVAASSGIPFICLTDQPDLTSETWQVVQVPTAFAMDPVRSQRLLKILPHQMDALAEYDASLYIDNSVVLKVPPEEILARQPWSSGMGLMQHSFRENVHDEFLEVARLGFDDPSRIFEQLNHYLLTDEAALAERPYWNGILLRRHDHPAVVRTMELWAAHVLRYSRRDQLSLNVALRATGLVVDAWPLDNMDSWFHWWPHAPDRVRFAGPRLPMNSLMPALTRVRDLESRNAQQQAALAALRDVHEQALSRIGEAEQQLLELPPLRQRLDLEQQQLLQRESERDQALKALDLSQQREAGLLADQARLLQEVQQLQTARSLLEQRLSATVDAFRSSTSWRISAPLRKFRSWLA